MAIENTYNFVLLFDVTNGNQTVTPTRVTHHALTLRQILVLLPTFA